MDDDRWRFAMDADCFEALIRLLIPASSRRGVLAGLATSLLAALSLGPSSEQAAARRRRRCRRPCGPCKRCRRGRCRSTCRGPLTCQDGNCRCPGGGQLCGRICTDLATDSANCGSCGNQCGAGQGCFEGRCLTAVGTCTAGSDACVALIGCNAIASCACWTSVTGAIRCGETPGGGGGSFCGHCTSNEDCISRFGAGAFCAACCGASGRICKVPCPS
jgi:hypothetical protein